MKNILSGPINDIKIKKLLGIYDGCVMVFDYTTQKWNQNKFMGYKIPDQESDTIAALEMRDSIENNSLMGGRKLVAAVSTVINTTEFIGVRQPIPRPTPDQFGTCIAGNIITYDQEHDILYGPGNDWMCVYRMPYTCDAAIYAGLNFARCLTNRLDYQNALLKMHIK